MTSEKLELIWRENPKGLVKAFTDMLVEFGYPSLKEEDIEKTIKKYYTSETEPSPEGVIDSFIFGWLKDGID